jgi:hypothetical protein
LFISKTSTWSTLSLSNDVQGKELIDFWFWNKMQIQVCSIVPKRKRGMKLWDGTTTKFTNVQMWVQGEINLYTIWKKWLMQIEAKIMHGLHCKKT